MAFGSIVNCLFIDLIIGAKMFYEVKAFVSQTSVIIGHIITDQNEIQWIVLAREPVKINREQWYIYQVMATLT
jgi:hypothetical protein